GGVNAIVSPTTNILTCKLKALSPQGHSRAFDASADGYLRGEGCGVVALRRLSDAQRDGDPVLAVIRASAVGHNGASSGLTAPNPQAQEKVIRQALDRAGVDPRDIDYLEAHGTGTELGDPIEIQAAAAALASDRHPDKPLLVGSVKTNIGHLEAAAGMAGLIKVLLAIQNEKIPAQLNFREPNPHIPWDQLDVQVVDRPVEWPQADQPRIASVSAFGMSGTNAHVVVEAPPANKVARSATVAGAAAGASQPWLLTLSGKTAEALSTRAEDLAAHLAEADATRLADVAYTTCTARSHMEERAALVARDREQAIEQLILLSRGGEAGGLFRGNGRRAPKVAWQFTGQGAQYVDMARGLYETQAVFRTAIDHCQQQLDEWRDVPLTEVLFENETLIHATHWTQPAIFAVQMGLVQLLQSWGLRPDVVLGHSVGQYAAACVAGIMSWDDGLRLISERGRLIGALPSGGRMLAVFAPQATVEEAIVEVPAVSLAALNGTHIVISGPEEGIEQAEARFQERGIRTNALQTSHAFHSTLMEPVLEPFCAVADSIEFRPGQLPLVCNVSGSALPADAVLDGAYWARHIREPVRFAQGIEAVQDLGCGVLVEVGPQAILTRMAASHWRQPTSALVSCLQEEADDAEALQHAVSQLYVAGATPDFDAIYAGKDLQRVLLPTYPFQRRRFWGPDKPRAAHAEFHTAHPLLGRKIALAGITSEIRYESFIEPDSPPWLADHRVMGDVVMPGAAWVEMAGVAAQGGAVSQITFEQPLRPAARTALQTIVRKGENGAQQIEIHSTKADDTNWTRHFSATIADSRNEPVAKLDRAEIEASCTASATPDEFYQQLEQIGLFYGPQCRTVTSLRYSQQEVLARLETVGDVRGFTLPPTLLDGALHSLAVGLLRDDQQHLDLPVGIGRVEVLQPVDSQVWCHAVWKQNEGKQRTADLRLFNDEGEVVALILDLQVQQITRAAFRQLSGAGPERLLYTTDWQDFRLPAPTTESTRWLLVHVDDSSRALAEALAESLAERGHSSRQLSLVAGAALEERSDSEFAIGPDEAQHWQSLLEKLYDEGDFTPDGIAWMVADCENERTLAGKTKAHCTGLLHLIGALQQRGLRRLQCGLQLVTADALATELAEDVLAQQAQFSGLARVIGAEQPELRCRMIDISSKALDAPETVAAVCEILLTETTDSQLQIRAGRFTVPRLHQARVPRRHDPVATRLDASYLITGGLGMLGRQAAKWLAERGAGQVVLVSRRDSDESTRAFLDSIEQLGCQVIVHAANISVAADVEKLISRFGGELLPLAGVVHAAGVLDDGLLTDQNWQRFEKVLAAKVVGAQLLHDFTQDKPLDFFILYSSVAAVLGSPGQSNYATANAYLDGLAWHRRAHGLPALSINWGPWTEGMAADEQIVKRLALQGITPLTVAEAHDAMEKL
ncbi:MAG: type I polyketide synthase, partial [Bythopirellula sp.]